MIIRVLLYFILLLSVACSSNSEQRLNYALTFAGENRGELEKVLTHYADDPEKLAAARFLIENMPYHYSYQNQQIDSIKSAFTNAIQRKSISLLDNRLILVEQVINKWRLFSYFESPKIYDSHIITADFLIENIDFAFKVWKKYPWNKHLVFEDFCELILPYRIGDEPLSNWRKLYYDHYTPLLDSLYQGTDVIEAGSTISQILKKEEFYSNTNFTLPHLGGEYLFHNRVGYCRDGCDVVNYAMRSVGIPVTTDFYIYSPDLRTWHCWNAIRDTMGTFYPFWYTQNGIERSVTNDNRRKGKAYRDCFGLQSERFIEYLPNNDILPFFRNCFMKDVTANYSGENEITLPVSDSDIQYVYLCVFNNNGTWEPVDIASVKRGKAIFRDIEPDVVFQLVHLKNGNKETYGYPFVYDTKQVIHFTPDTNQLVPARLTRKYPFRKYQYSHLNRNTIGLTFYGSHTPSGAKQLLYTFTDSIFTNRIPILFHPAVPYRYLHLQAPIDHQIELCELIMYSDSAGTHQLPARLLQNAEGQYPTEEHSAKAMIDGDPLTFFKSKKTHIQLTLDLGEKAQLGKILYIPRNDDNYIVPGECYELYYQDGENGWKLIEKETARSQELHYKVPKNALFWLHNSTKGQEEQLFFIKGGEQIFSHFIQFSKGENK